MSAENIYATLIKAGLSPVGACAMMGNMQAESAMRSNNAQDGMGSLTDAEYTEKTDSGLYQSFVTDSIGYGLCQWTYAPRKRNLLEFARSRGVSIGDEAMQVEFCLWELRNEYSHLLKYLYTATNLYEATGRVCTEYERPAVNNISVRAAFANEFYCQFGGMDIGSVPSVLVSVPGAASSEAESGFELAKETVMHLQAILAAHGYAIGTVACPSGVDGYLGRKTVEALKQFTARLEALI